MNAFTWHRLLLASFLAILVWSGIHPKDHFIWFLEVVPAIVGALVLVMIYSKVKLTPAGLLPDLAACAGADAGRSLDLRGNAAVQLAAR